MGKTQLNKMRQTETFCKIKRWCTCWSKTNGILSVGW